MQSQRTWNVFYWNYSVLLSIFKRGNFPILETFDLYFTVENIWVDLVWSQGWDLAPQLHKQIF